MGHEIDRSRIAEGAVFSVRQSMWHRLGKVLQFVPKNVEEAMEFSGTDFEVELIPLYARSGIGLGGKSLSGSPTSGYVYDDVQLGRGVRRKDTGKVIGVVGPSYHPLQNVDAFGVLQPMLDQGLATIETGGSLRDGQDVWLLVKFDKAALARQAGEKALNKDLLSEEDRQALAALEELASDGEVETYGLITNNHAGKRMVIVRETPVRVVCANTLEFALDSTGTEVKCRHTENVKENVEAAAKLLFASMAERYASAAVQRAILKRLPINEEQFRQNVLDVAVPVRHLERKIQRRESSPQTHAALDRANDKRLLIRNRWESGEGHTGDHSAWEAWNGLVECLDHEEQFAPRGDEQRLQSAYDGTLRLVKQKVVNRLLALR